MSISAGFKKKRLIALGVSLMILTIGMFVFPQRIKSTEPVFSTEGATADQRIAFLEQFGWEVEAEPLEVREIHIPEEFDDVYTRYNELQSLRSLESCQSELAYLQQLYFEYKDKIVPCFDKAIVAADDLLFNLNAQKDFYKEKLSIIPNARHHIFFRFNSFEELIK